MAGFGDLSAMSTLLEESRNASEQLAEKAALPTSAVGGTVVKARSAIVADSQAAELEKERNKAEIFNVDNVPIEDALLCNTIDDGRETPRYEFSYKQSVGTQDTFMNINGKTNASFDASHLIIKIHFPNAQMKDLDLDVTKNRIKAESKEYKLFTYLPVNVEHDKGKAQFDSKRHVLTITVPIIGFFEDEDRQF
jgi:hypothetical protein